MCMYIYIYIYSNICIYERSWTLEGVTVGGQRQMIHRVDGFGPWSGRWSWQKWSVDKSTTSLECSEFILTILDNQDSREPCTQLGQLCLVEAEEVGEARVVGAVVEDVEDREE